MKSLLLVLSICLCTVHSVPSNPRDLPKNDTLEPWYDTQDYSYTVTLDLRMNRTTIRYCGGAQIGLEWVLTAAECLHNDTEWSAIVLTYKTGTMKYKYHLFPKRFAKFAIHPDYDPNTKSHNIAVIKCLYCGIVNKSVIPTVPLGYLQRHSYSQKPAVVSAVLNIEHDGNIYDQYVYPLKTHIVSPFWCKVAHFFSVGENHICASRLAERLPKAEIGAPLVIEGHLQGVVQVIGIGTSKSRWPNWTRVPMVFTRVEPYCDWIRNITDVK